MGRTRSTNSGRKEIMSVYLLEEDVLLNRWRLNVKKDGSYSIGMLIKTALRYYIKTQTFICIGKAYLDANDVEARKRHTTTIYLSDAPDIKNWIDAMRPSGIRLSSLIKKIIFSSVIEVQSRQEEWLPDIMDLITINQRLIGCSPLLTSPATQDNMVPSVPTVEMNVPHMEPVMATANNNTSVSTPSFASEVKQNKPSSGTAEINTDEQPEAPVAKKKKKGRALALAGIHYVN